METKLGGFIFGFVGKLFRDLQLLIRGLLVNHPEYAPPASALKKLNLHFRHTVYFCVDDVS
jgi:hypothetical protein